MKGLLLILCLTVLQITYSLGRNEYRGYYDSGDTNIITDDNRSNNNGRNSYEERNYGRNNEQRNNYGGNNRGKNDNGRNNYEGNSYGGNNNERNSYEGGYYGENGNRENNYEGNSYRGNKYGEDDNGRNSYESGNYGGSSNGRNDYGKMVLSSIEILKVRPHSDGVLEGNLKENLTQFKSTFKFRRVRDSSTQPSESKLYRHGDRSPEATYPNDRYSDVRKYWPEGLGELSKTGKKQHYELGQFIRRRYKGFLPLKYNSSDVYVRSSDYDRCLMSAESNLLGLYPPTSDIEDEPVFYQTIPIHTAPMGNDSIVFPFENCPRYWSELALLMQSKEYNCVQNVTAKVQEEISKNAGYSHYEPSIYDIFLIQNLYNLTIPQWGKKYFPQPLEALYLFEYFIKDAGTRELQRLSTGPLLQEMVTNMVSKTKGTLNPDRKLFVYSAHDTTVSHLLMALDVHNGILPPYASTVFVELREKYGKYYVLVSYRNTTLHEPYVLKLPGCKEPLCSLHEFVKITDALIPKDLFMECNSNPKPGVVVHFHIPAHGVPRDWERCFPEGKTKDGRYYVISYRHPQNTRESSRMGAI